MEWNGHKMNRHIEEINKGKYLILIPTKKKQRNNKKI